MDSSQYNIVKDFFSLLHINISNKHFYSFQTYKNKKFLAESNKPIDYIYTNYLNNARTKWRANNVYFYVNEGSTLLHCYDFSNLGYRKKESRKSKDRLYYNAFYFDFDITNEKGEHLTDNELQQEKSILLPKLKNLYPTAIIESRNGFHLYFALADKDRCITEITWRHTELAILDWLFYNVSYHVDYSVKDPARILRVPFSNHKKDDSDLFQVTINTLNHKQYSIEELNKKFNINQQIDKQTQEHTERQTAATAAISLSNDEVVQAIKNLDVKFFNYIPQIPNRFQDSKQVADYIKSYDMFHFLQIDKNEKEMFHSIIRDDKNPSAFIDIVEKDNQNIYLYTDLGVNKFSKDIIGFIEYISDTDRKTAFKFLCNIFFSNNQIITKHTKHIDDFIQDNIQVMKSLASNKQFKFLDKVIPTYVCILDMLKQQTLNKNVPYKEFRLQVARDYISKTYDIPKTKVTRCLRILFHLGIINDTQAYTIQVGKKSIKTCTFNDLTVHNVYDFIYRSLIALTLRYSNIMQLTSSDLRQVQIFI